MRRELVSALPSHVALVATRPLIWTFCVAWSTTSLPTVAVLILRMRIVVAPVTASVPVAFKPVPAPIAVVRPLSHSASSVLPFRGPVTLPVVHAVSRPVALPVGVLTRVAVAAIPATLRPTAAVAVVLTRVLVISIHLRFFASLFGLFSHCRRAVVAWGLPCVTLAGRRVRLAFLTRGLGCALRLLALAWSRIRDIWLWARISSRRRKSWRFARRGLGSRRWLVLCLSCLLCYLHHPLCLFFVCFVLYLGV